MEEKYILVIWPESQQFMGCENAFFSDSEKLGSSAYFVEESLYNKGMRNPDVYGEDLNKLEE